MADKYITEYTAETSPPATDAILIDQGSGAYKYMTITTLSANLGPITSTGALVIAGAASGITTLGCGAITSTGDISITTAGNPTLSIISTADGNGVVRNENTSRAWLTGVLGGTSGSWGVYDVTGTATRMSISSAGLLTVGTGMAVTAAGAVSGITTLSLLGGTITTNSTSLPTSNPGAGILWNNGGVVTVGT